MNAMAGDQSPAPDPAVADFLMLNEEIAALVQARLPLEDHLALAGAELPKTSGKLASRVAKRLSEGISLPDAIETECASLPAAYRAVIISGLKSGRLSAALESLVDTATRCDQLRRTTAVALLYPIIVALVASLAFALVVTRVVPTFTWLNQSHFGLANKLARYPSWVTIGAVAVPCVIAIVFIQWWRRSGRIGQKTFGPLSFLGLLPGARRVRYWSQAATFAELLQLLVESDLPLDTALQLAANAVDSDPLQRSGIKIAEAIERGESAFRSNTDAATAEASGVPLLIRMALQHGANRLLLTGGLRQAATLYRERAARAAEWYTEYIPVLLTVGLAGTLTVGFTLFVLWPYASMLREVAGAQWR